jgi:hypothetical protein
MKIKFFTSYYLIFSQGFKISRMIYISASSFFSHLFPPQFECFLFKHNITAVFLTILFPFFSALSRSFLSFFILLGTAHTRKIGKKFSLIALTYQTHTGHHHITHDKKANRNSFSLCSISFMSFKIIA